MNFTHETLEIVKICKNFLVVYNWDELTDSSCPKVWENVQLFDPSGKKVWTVNGMSNCRYWRNDVFVGTRVMHGRRQLISFNGYSYDLDIQTGKVTFFEFHK